MSARDRQMSRQVATGDNNRMAPYEDWLTKQEAAERLQRSVKHIERLAKAGEIQQAERVRPGKRAATVYHPDDVARIAAELAPQAHLMPPDSQPGAMIAAPGALVPAAAPAAPVHQPWGTWLDAFAQRPEPKRLTRVLTLPEPSGVCGLSVHYLREAIRTEQLRAVRDGRTWKVRIEDLEAL